MVCAVLNIYNGGAEGELSTDAFRGFIYNMPRCKSIVLLHSYATPGSNWSPQPTNCSDAAHTDSFWTHSLNHAGTLHILRCRIKALCFPATQQGLRGQTLVHTQVFIQKLWCVCTSLSVGVVEDKESVSSLMSPLLPLFAWYSSERKPADLQVHFWLLLARLLALRMPSQLFVDLREAVEKATVPVLTIPDGSHE